MDNNFPYFREKAEGKIAELRSSPISQAVNSDSVKDLLFFLEQAMAHIAHLEGKTQVAPGGNVLTVGMLKDILAEIDDQDLRRFFVRRVERKLTGVETKEPMRIQHG